MECNKTILKIFWAVGLLKLNRSNHNYFTYKDVDWGDIAIKYFLLSVLLLIEAIFVPGYNRLVALMVGNFLLDRARQRCLCLVKERNCYLRLIELEAICQSHSFTPPSALVYCYGHGFISREQLYEEIERSSIKPASMDWNKECQFYSCNEFLHCAVNPDGGCNSCDDFRPKHE